MATEKQRRRRVKEKRHGFELVEIDADGNEVVLSGSATRSETEKPVKVKATAKAPAKRSRWGEPQPPSWPRVFKRAAIFGPLFVVLLLVTNGKASTTAALLNGVILVAVMVPMMYFLDRVMWRQVQKRQANPSSRAKPRR